MSQEVFRRFQKALYSNIVLQGFTKSLQKVPEVSIFEYRTSGVSRRFQKVLYLKLEKNRGKNTAKILQDYPN